MNDPIEPLLEVQLLGCLEDDGNVLVIQALEGRAMVVTVLEVNRKKRLSSVATWFF